MAKHFKKDWDFHYINNKVGFYTKPGAASKNRGIFQNHNTGKYSSDGKTWFSKFSDAVDSLKKK